MPMSSKISPSIIHDYNYKSKFSHEKEKAKPHFYDVFLETWDINVELTSTQFVGLHRYKFNKQNSPKTVVFYVRFEFVSFEGFLVTH
jgi:putative alpha-1,2-mannosidase